MAGLPLRVRLVAGFAAAMLVVLTAAGAFVYLRVRYALDLRLNEDLAAQATLLDRSIAGGAVPALAPGTEYQILDATGHVLAGSPGRTGASLLTAAQAARARTHPLHADRGDLFPIRPGTLRLYAIPLSPSPGGGAPGTAPPGTAAPGTAAPGTAAPGTAAPRGAVAGAAVAVVGTRRDQRDEALRELIGQLVLANLAALAVASLVGYRLTRAALAPVERYRAEATRIAAGATALRLEVPDRRDDELTRLGHTLNDMLAALDAALTRERRLVHDASHELRTPLTLISTEIELALRRPRPAGELEQTLRNLAADTDRLRRLADTLLVVGTPAAPSTVDTDLAALAREVAVPFPGVTVDAVGPVVVRADPIRLRQVLTNLIDNAARHGAPPIQVTLRSLGAAGPGRADAAAGHGVAAVTVHDAGPGMDAEFLSHATERFTRADSARTTEGFGLGLSLAETIVLGCGGVLRLCSGAAHRHGEAMPELPCTHPGRGTTATVLLPTVAERPGP
ncbi:ATP-binding protein [Actinoplanes sp. CA-030573]|uniref:sensor histidine kinase n=1 Tax=Actinoplanes sp. CA-030573 TaxID=3239898 RepID=UPI003D8FDDA4